MQVLILDPPRVEQRGSLRSLDADDVHPGGPGGAVSHAAHVREGTGHLLLHVHVTHVERTAERQVPEHVDVVAPALQRSPLLGGGGSGSDGHVEDERQRGAEGAALLG